LEERTIRRIPEKIFKYEAYSYLSNFMMRDADEKESRKRRGKFELGRALRKSKKKRGRRAGRAKTAGISDTDAPKGKSGAGTIRGEGTYRRTDKGFLRREKNKQGKKLEERGGTTTNSHSLLSGKPESSAPG